MVFIEISGQLLWGTIDIIIELDFGCKSIFVVNPLVYIYDLLSYSNKVQ